LTLKKSAKEEGGVDQRAPLLARWGVGKRHKGKSRSQPGEDKTVAKSGTRRAVGRVVRHSESKRQQHTDERKRKVSAKLSTNIRAKKKTVTELWKKG